MLKSSAAEYDFNEFRLTSFLFVRSIFHFAIHNKLITHRTYSKSFLFSFVVYIFEGEFLRESRNSWITTWIPIPVIKIKFLWINVDNFEKNSKRHIHPNSRRVDTKLEQTMNITFEHPFDKLYLNKTSIK